MTPIEKLRDRAKRLLENRSYLPAGRSEAVPAPALPLKSSESLRPILGGSRPVIPPASPALWVSPELDILQPDAELAALLPSAQDVYFNTTGFRRLDVYYAAWLRARLNSTAQTASDAWKAEMKAKWAILYDREPTIMNYPMPTLFSYQGPLPAARRTVELTPHVYVEISDRPINWTPAITPARPGAARRGPTDCRPTAEKLPVYKKPRLSFTTPKRRRKKS